MIDKIEKRCLNACGGAAMPYLGQSNLFAPDTMHLQLTTTAPAHTRFSPSEPTESFSQPFSPKTAKRADIAPRGSDVVDEHREIMDCAIGAEGQK